MYFLLHSTPLLGAAFKDCPVIIFLSAQFHNSSTKGMICRENDNTDCVCGIHLICSHSLCFQQLISSDLSVHSATEGELSRCSSVEYFYRGSKKNLCCSTVILHLKKISTYYTFNAPWVIKWITPSRRLIYDLCPFVCRFISRILTKLGLRMVSTQNRPH